MTLRCLQKDDEGLPILLGKIKSEGMARNCVGFLSKGLNMVGTKLMSPFGEAPA